MVNDGQYEEVAVKREEPAVIKREPEVEYAPEPVAVQPFPSENQQAVAALASWEQQQQQQQQQPLYQGYYPPPQPQPPMERVNERPRETYYAVPAPRQPMQPRQPMRQRQMMQQMQQRQIQQRQQMQPQPQRRGRAPERPKNLEIPEILPPSKLVYVNELNEVMATLRKRHWNLLLRIPNAKRTVKTCLEEAPIVMWQLVETLESRFPE